MHLHWKDLLFLEPTDKIEFGARDEEVATNAHGTIVKMKTMKSLEGEGHVCSSLFSFFDGPFSQFGTSIMT